MIPYTPTLPCKPGETVWWVNAYGPQPTAQEGVVVAWKLIRGPIELAVFVPVGVAEDEANWLTVNVWELFPTQELAEAACRKRDGKQQKESAAE
jgi:hypothetical protein